MASPSLPLPGKPPRLIFSTIPKERTAGLSGHLKILCQADEAGRTYLARQSTRAPIHLSKSYWDGRTLGLQLVNSTAGLLSGDRVECEVRVDSGARLSVTTPSATRIFTMERDHAEVRQEFLIADGASLIFMPSPIVPHRKSRYRQQTRISVAKGGELFFVDSLAPGRVAHGEQGLFDELNFETELEYRGRLVIRERFALRGNSTSAQSFYACAYIVTERLDQKSTCWGEISALHEDGCWVGVTEPSPGTWVVKILARSSPGLRGALFQIRHLMHSIFPVANRMQMNGAQG